MHYGYIRRLVLKKLRSHGLYKFRVESTSTASLAWGLVKFTVLLWIGTVDWEYVGKRAAYVIVMTGALFLLIALTISNHRIANP